MKLRHIFPFAFVALLFIGCGSNELSLKQKTEKFIKDSVLTSFNDPKSFELVSIKNDSVSNHLFILQKKGDYLDQLKSQNSKLSLNRLQMISDKMESTGTALDKQILDGGKSIDSNINKTISIINESIERCDKQLLIPDSLHHINVEISYRAKNKMGALALDNMLLSYYPKTNNFEIVRLQDKQSIFLTQTFKLLQWT